MLRDWAAVVRCVLGSWKDAAQTISYVVGIIVAILAICTYRSNAQRERARWAVQLYEKFFEADQYKPVRESLDIEPTSAKKEDIEAVAALVRDEPAAFTDYLNFFEMVALLAETKQLSQPDVVKLFDYYLGCLKRHPDVLRYVQNKDKGFEQLSRLLGKPK